VDRRVTKTRVALQKETLDLYHFFAERIDHGIGFAAFDFPMRVLSTFASCASAARSVC